MNALIRLKHLCGHPATAPTNHAAPTQPSKAGLDGFVGANQVSRPDTRSMAAGLMAAAIAPLPLTAQEREALGRWLAHIGEHDPVLIAAFYRQVSTSNEARDYFLTRASEECI